MRTKNHRRRPGMSLAAGILAAALALTGCSATQGNTGSSAAGAPRAPGAAGAAGAVGAAGSGAQPRSGTAGSAPSAAPPGSASGPGATPANRSVIYTGEIQLRSARVDDAVEQAQTLVRAVGGYIDSEQVGDAGTMPWNEGAASGSATPQALPLAPPPDASGEAAVLELRVPSASYDAVFTQLSSLGTVLARERSSQDVTEQVVDLDARITSGKASLDRLNALMRQAGSLNDMLTLEQAVTQRESDLNSLESQIASLRGQVAMSTVTVELFRTATPPAAPKPKPSGAWSAAGHALGAGWHGLYLVGRGLLVALSASLPFLVLLALLGYGVYRFTRRDLKAPGRKAPERTQAEDEAVEE